MAEIRLADDRYLKRARRLFRRSGIRLTVRNGRIYTVKAVEIKQPKTERQLKNWAVFTEANRLTDLDLRENGRRRYWRRRARELGYKTARGCAKAHFVRMVKEGRASERTEKEMVEVMQRGWIYRRLRKKRPVWTGQEVDVTLSS